MNTMINFIVTYIIWNIPNIKFLNDFENGTLRIFSDVFTDSFGFQFRVDLVYLYPQTTGKLIKIINFNASKNVLGFESK